MKEITVPVLAKYERLKWFFGGIHLLLIAYSLNLSIYGHSAWVAAPIALLFVTVFFWSPKLPGKPLRSLRDRILSLVANSGLLVALVLLGLDVAVYAAARETRCYAAQFVERRPNHWNPQSYPGTVLTMVDNPYWRYRVLPGATELEASVRNDPYITVHKSRKYLFGFPIYGPEIDSFGRFEDFYKWRIMYTDGGTPHPHEERYRVPCER